MATRPQPRARSRPQLRVVPGAGKRRVSLVPFIAILIATVFGVTGIRAAQGQDGLKAAKIERVYSQEQETHVLLTAKVADLSSPGRIADEAGKLGLVPAANPTFLRVPEVNDVGKRIP